LFQERKNKRYEAFEKYKTSENGFQTEEILSGSNDSNYCYVEKNCQNYQNGKNENNNKQIDNQRFNKNPSKASNRRFE